jgi:hypothetical protein
MRPNTYGDPVAFFGEPNDAAPVEADVELEDEAPVDEPPELLLGELLPHPATARAAAPATATAVNGLRSDLIRVSFPSLE